MLPLVTGLIRASVVMLSREFTQMIGELIEKSLFKTQWVGNKNFLGLLGFLLRETLSAKHTLRERER
jgi:hypothetical protein